MIAAAQMALVGCGRFHKFVSPGASDRFFCGEAGRLCPTCGGPPFPPVLAKPAPRGSVSVSRSGEGWVLRVYAETEGEGLGRCIGTTWSATRPTRTDKANAVRQFLGADARTA